jgi:hypothetical protein
MATERLGWELSDWGRPANTSGVQEGPTEWVGLATVGNLRADYPWKFGHGLKSVWIGPAIALKS